MENTPLLSNLKQWETKLSDSLQFIRLTTDSGVGMAQRRYAFKRACIRARTQRTYNYSDLKHQKIEIYENLVLIKPLNRVTTSGKPPSRSGEVIHEFSKKSRNRLLKKCRTIRKNDMPLPFFVTLTYQKNFTDCEHSKKHLNTFLQRFRRKCKKNNVEFNYIWKMEFQKRGAVHYHLALFIPHDLYGNLDQLRQKMGLMWAQVTSDINDGQINPQQRDYGTNVRTVENWEMFIGYIAKYLGKTEQAFNEPLDTFIQRLDKRYQDKENPFRKKLDVVIEHHRSKQQKTGRFWGMSRGFDFSPILEQIIEIDTDKTDTHDSKESMLAYFDHINDLSFDTYTENHKKQLDYANNLKGKKKQYRLNDLNKKYKKAFSQWKNRSELVNNSVVVDYQTGEIKKELNPLEAQLQLQIDADTALKLYNIYLSGTDVPEFYQNRGNLGYTKDLQAEISFLRRQKDKDNTSVPPKTTVYPLINKPCPF